MVLHPNILANFLRAKTIVIITTWDQAARFYRNNSGQKPHARLAIDVATPALWNNLPNAIRSATSTNSFKKLLKTHLIKIAFDL